MSHPGTVTLADIENDDVTELFAKTAASMTEADKCAAEANKRLMNTIGKYQNLYKRIGSSLDFDTVKRYYDEMHAYDNKSRPVLIFTKTAVNADGLREGIEQVTKCSEEVFAKKQELQESLRNKQENPDWIRKTNDAVKNLENSFTGFEQSWKEFNKEWILPLKDRILAQAGPHPYDDLDEMRRMIIARYYLMEDGDKKNELKNKVIPFLQKIEDLRSSSLLYQERYDSYQKRDEQFIGFYKEEVEKGSAAKSGVGKYFGVQSKRSPSSKVVPGQEPASSIPEKVADFRSFVEGINSSIEGYGIPKPSVSLDDAMRFRNSVFSELKAERDLLLAEIGVKDRDLERLIKNKVPVEVTSGGASGEVAAASADVAAKAEASPRVPVTAAAARSSTPVAEEPVSPSPLKPKGGRVITVSPRGETLDFT